MISFTMAPDRPNGRVQSVIPFLFSAVFLAGGLFAILPAHAAETGIKGTVLWGPVRPGPTSVGQSDEAPFQATFIVLAVERKVAQFKSDKKGNFEVLLPLGDYTIVPDKSTPIPAPQSQKKSVTVPADGFIEVTLRFDTGMR